MYDEACNLFYVSGRLDGFFGDFFCSDESYFTGTVENRLGESSKMVRQFFLESYLCCLVDVNLCGVKHPGKIP